MLTTAQKTNLLRLTLEFELLLLNAVNNCDRPNFIDINPLYLGISRDIQSIKARIKKC